MKKIYCKPQIKICLPMPELLFVTDTTGDTKRGFNFDSRRNSYFDEEDEEEITKSVWFDD